MSVSSSNEGSGRSPTGNAEPCVSCVTCKKRKVKCDKNVPCANCARRHIECIYLTTEKKRTRGPGKHRAGERLEQMTSRVAQLEQVLGKLQSRNIGEGQSPGQDNPRENLESVSVGQQESQGGKSTKTDGFRTGEGEEENRSTSRLLVKGGKSQYIRNKFWASINEELGDSEDLLGDESYATPSQSHDDEAHPAASSSHDLLFGSLGSSIDLSVFRPPVFQIPLYWQIFKENVDAVYKLIHKPATDKIIRIASNSNSTLSPSHEALLFAICFAVVTSMTAAKVQNTFQDSKNHLLGRYRCGLERSLSRAGLLSTQELTTLQAFTILIICTRRNNDSRTSWALVGLACRLAVGMGLQHDGSKFNLSPWETEMRRRLWWQIYLCDVRAAEDQGCEVTISEDSFDTKLPLNINDDDLDVNATDFPPARIGITEMSTALMRSEVVATGRLIRVLDHGLSTGGPSLSLREKVEAIKACERSIHHKYLQYCRPDVPISVFTYTLAKHCIAKMSLMAHQPDYRTRCNDQVPSTLAKPELSRDELFVMSISIIEGSQFLETAPALEKWAWVSRKYVQWHPIAYVLTELGSASRQPGALVDRAWRVVEGLCRDDTERMADRSNTAINRPVEKLLEKAYRRRAETTGRHGRPNESRTGDLEQWNLQQFVGSTSENFDWFLGAPEGDASMMANSGGYVQQLETPMSLPVQDAEFWNDMTGLFQGQPFENNGAIVGGEMSDWW